MPTFRKVYSLRRGGYKNGEKISEIDHKIHQSVDQTILNFRKVTSNTLPNPWTTLAFMPMH
jgi:hypothetical protein